MLLSYATVKGRQSRSRACADDNVPAGEVNGAKENTKRTAIAAGKLVKVGLAASTSTIYLETPDLAVICPVSQAKEGRSSSFSPFCSYFRLPPGT